MLLIVIPDILTIYQRDRICAANREVIAEHEQMIKCIEKRDGEQAAELMSQHLRGVLNFAKSNLIKP